jgi:hypothetical protein
MCKEFFKPTWKKVIGFVAVNSLALLVYVLAYNLGESTFTGTFFTYFYLVLAPFGLLLNVVSSLLLSWGVNLNLTVVVIFSIIQNILEFAWQYAIACFVINAYCKIFGRKAVIITKKKAKK